MAVVTLSVKDDTQRLYTSYFPQNPNKVMADQLEKFKESNPKERTFFFSGEQRAKLEKLFERDLFDNKEQFIQWVSDLKSIDLEGTKVVLSEAQRKQLTMEAGKFGKPIGEWIKERLETVFRQMWGA